MTPPRVDAGELAALEEERQFLLDSLRDLEDQRVAGDIADDDYETLREDYTVRTAAVLRRIEDAQAPLVSDSRPRSPRRKGARGRVRARRQTGATAAREAAADDRPARRRRRTALTMLVVLGVASVAGVSVAVFAGDRSPGQSATGRDLSGPAGLLAEAHTLETEGKAADALKLYDAVIEADPANVEALTYKGWLLARAGLVDPAMAALDQAVSINPRYPDAHFFRGMVLYRSRNDPAGAIPEFEAFLANNPPPDSVAAVQEVLQRAKDDAAKGPTPPTTAPTNGPPAGP